MEKSIAIKEIRSRLALSQTELARLVGVSFATVNRWENGHFEPSPIALKALKQLCKERMVDFSLYEGNRRKIGEGNITLYHGGESLPGQSLPFLQEKGLTLDFQLTPHRDSAYHAAGEAKEGRVYTLHLDLGALSVLEVEAGFDWIMLLAMARGKLTGGAMYEKYQKLLAGCDLLVGYAASGSLASVLDRFLEEEITDTALLQSISAVSPHKQYFLLSEKALNQLSFITEETLCEEDKTRLLEENTQMLRREKVITDETLHKYRREGLFFDEILEKEG